MKTWESNDTTCIFSWTFGQIDVQLKSDHCKLNLNPEKLLKKEQIVKDLKTLVVGDLTSMQTDMSAVCGSKIYSILQIIWSSCSLRDQRDIFSQPPAIYFAIKSNFTQADFSIIPHCEGKCRQLHI